jgi:hypothetical protein
MGRVLRSNEVETPSQGDTQYVYGYKLIEREVLSDLQETVNAFTTLLLVATEPPYYIEDIQYSNYETLSLSPPFDRIVWHVAAVRYVIVG